MTLEIFGRFLVGIGEAVTLLVDVFFETIFPIAICKNSRSNLFRVAKIVAFKTQLPFCEFDTLAIEIIKPEVIDQFRIEERYLDGGMVKP
ncbi:MAG: hypothetical protein ABGX16_15730 [Pirellulales bacterium]